MVSFLVTIECDYDQLLVYDMVEHKKNICRMRRFYQLKVERPCLSRDQRFVFFNIILIMIMIIILSFV